MLVHPPHLQVRHLDQIKNKQHYRLISFRTIPFHHATATSPYYALDTSHYVPPPLLPLSFTSTQDLKVLSPIPYHPSIVLFHQ